jgi:hypothetical protein
MKERRGVRRLIETDEMPIGVISEHSRKDQNVRKGHLHTLHVWWATRPLASCRAVLMATILPDPADENCPEDFRREAQETLKDFNWRSPSDPLGLRKALLEFIAHFAAWENSNNPNYVKTARRLVRAAHSDGPPLVVDPFAGIGSIPFEALRIGADAFAGDLNPVAVLLNKVALEYLPTYGQGGQSRPPLHEPCASGASGCGRGRFRSSASSIPWSRTAPSPWPTSGPGRSAARGPAAGPRCPWWGFCGSPARRNTGWRCATGGTGRARRSCLRSSSRSRRARSSRPSSSALPPPARCAATPRPTRACESRSAPGGAGPGMPA